MQQEGTRCRFALHRMPQDGDGICARRAVLIMRNQAGDRGEQVVTIVLPWQD